MGFFFVLALLIATAWISLRAPALRRDRGGHSITLLVQAFLFSAAAAYLTYYATSEDSYRRGGISRWEAYDAHFLTVVAIATCCALAGLAFVAESRRGRALLFVGPACLAGAALFIVALLANSLN